jgi:NAD(P)H-hydrate epimerase
MIPIALAEAVKNIERRSGLSPEELMRRAGKGVADLLPPTGRVWVVAGKGNNGGDGFAAALERLRRRQAVAVWAVYPESGSSPLNRKMRQEYVAAGGKIVERLMPEPGDQILDALLGLGFQGPALEARAADAIGAMGKAGAPLIALDLPSGLDPLSGIAADQAVTAHKTLAIGCYKSCFFSRDGWQRVGALCCVEIGLRLSEDDLVGYALEAADVRLPPIRRTQHKYERGYVVGYGGSTLFPGAGRLAALAALKGGAGIVRLFTDGPPGDAPPELIIQPWDTKSWRREMERASACFVGPGVEGGAPRLLEALSGMKRPVVLDAGALNCAAPEAVYTPHHGEMARLIGGEPADWIGAGSQWVRGTDRLLVLKGAPTWLFMDGKLPVTVLTGDPGMATAGSGDVLTGLIAALLAQGLGRWEGALAAVYLHGVAGEVAARAKTSRGYTASDLIDAFPTALQQLK